MNPKDLRSEGNVLLYIGDRKQAEQALQNLNQQLEDRIERRQAQLRQTNQQLLQEVREHRQTEEQLRLSEKAIAAGGNGIVLADARLEDHPIIFVNPAFEKITGYSAPEIFGKNLRFLLGIGG